MKHLVLVVLTLFAVVFAVNAWCWPWEDPGKIFLCATLNKTKCDWRTGTSMNCNNYDTGYPAISGYTDGNYHCIIFKGEDCEGDLEFINKTGFSPFPFRPRSYKCPCV